MEILGEAARTARGLRTFMYVFEGERDWFVSVEIVRAAAAAATTSTSTTSTLTFASTATAAVVVVVVAAVVAAALLLMVVVLAVPPPMTVPMVVVLGLSVCVGVVGVAQAFWCTDALIPGIRRDGG